ncbi:MAG: phosphoglycerate kinase [Pseudomonadota bacterium]
MAIRSVEQLSVEGKRVFVRVDFNVPLTPARGVADDSRIRASLPTIEHLRNKGARLVLASHLGRPKGGPDPKYSLEPVGAHLAELLGQEVLLTDEPVGDGARKVVSDLRDGQIALLENLRFHPGEEANDDQYARALASYADVYVNDAFGTAHRAHASTVGMVKQFAEKGAGFLMLKEVQFLSRLLGTVDRPYLAMLGGAKVSDKIAVLDSLVQRVDKMLVGGAMANTFLAAQGFSLGKSKIEKEKLALARSFLKKAEERGVSVLLPSDLVVAPSCESTHGEVVAAASCPAESMVLDIGPDTVKLFASEIASARTIFWNGPVGVFEQSAFAEGTLSLACAIGSNKRALSVVGGGDSVAAAVKAGMANEVSHISTGGGASLEFVEGKILPGIAILES